MLHDVVDELPKLTIKLPPAEMPKPHVDALRAYIPEAVRKWLELGQMQWLPPRWAALRVPGRC